MITKVQRWGNSQGVRLGKQLLVAIGVEVGDEVDVAVRDGVLVVTPVRRVRGAIRLGDLVAAVEDDYTPEELEWGRPAGKEVW